MSKVEGLTNYLTSSLQTAGLCTLFGWANPKAAVVGKVASNVTSAVLNPFKNFLWLNSDSKEKSYTWEQIVVNGALIVGTAIATAYVANYIGRQIDPNYNYLHVGWQEFKINAAIGIDVGLTEALISSQLTSKPEKETKEGETKSIPLVITPFLQNVLSGTSSIAGAAGLCGATVIDNTRLFAAGGIICATLRLAHQVYFKKEEPVEPPTTKPAVKA